MRTSKTKRIRELWESLSIGREMEVRILSLSGEQVDFDTAPFVIVEKCFEPLVVVTLGRSQELHLFRIIEDGGALLFRGLNPKVWKHRLDESKFSRRWTGFTIAFADPLFQIHATLGK